MEYLQKANEWVGTKLGNTATLSGAIDIIVVEQEDETFLSSPFYVRFGKFAKLTAKETDVYIEINDEPVDIGMKLDDDGNAVFSDILPKTDDEDDDVDFPKSIPISSPEKENLSCSEYEGDSQTDFCGKNGTPILHRLERGPAKHPSAIETPGWKETDIDNKTTFLEKEGIQEISTSISSMDDITSRTSQRLSSNDVLRSESIFREDGKSLRFSLDVLHALNLHMGENDIEFSVTTALQGTTRVRCNLFVWKWTDKIVISDIDGTITRSDVRGQMLPKFGKDWAQSGVAPLFTKISQNGYRIVYLSARPIGQATGTKDYLKSVIQGDSKLPDGPLLLTPDSLLISVHREVIIKNPEEFKIECLQTIQKLFPINPFYCGYGNRSNDVFAYTTVGIPISRIFTINPKGELKHEITPTSHSSYLDDSAIVDHIFPPLPSIPSKLSESNAISYSTFSYWREPFTEIDFGDVEM